MTTLRVIEGEARGATRTLQAEPPRLRPGRHGLPADLVREHQRQRIVEAAAAALDEQGYGRLTVARITELARVSSRTFYEHFDDLWSCMAAAYETEAEFVCKEIENACELAEGDKRARARTGIAAALFFLASEPPVARLLTAEPPPQTETVVAARLSLAERLGEMLRLAREEDDSPTPPALERRLIGAALAFVSTHIAAGEPQRLRELEPALSEFLLAPL